MAGGGNADRIAAVLSCSIDATVVSSPFEQMAEKQGLKTVASAREVGELVRIPVTGIVATQKKLEKDGDETVRLLRASILWLQQQPDYTISLFEKVMCLDRPSAEKFYALVCDQYNPDLTLADGAMDDLLAVGNFRSKEKSTFNAHAARDWTFAERAKR